MMTCHHKRVAFVEMTFVQTEHAIILAIKLRAKAEVPTEKKGWLRKEVSTMVRSDEILCTFWQIFPYIVNFQRYRNQLMLVSYLMQGTAPSIPKS